MKYKTFSNILLILISIITITGCTNYNEPYINVSLNDTTIKANTGSYCNNTQCVDTIRPVEMSYKKSLSGSVNSIIKILNLKEDITNIDIYEVNKNLEKSDYPLLTEKVKYSNAKKEITTPSLPGEYIVVINTIYNKKEITYSFKLVLE